MERQKFTDWKVEGLLPLSFLQEKALSRVFKDISEYDLCFKDVNNIMDLFSVQINNKEQMIEFLKWGGNAFFNHFMFSMTYLNKWKPLATHNPLHHIDKVALEMRSILPRMMYRYVWVEVNQEDGMHLSVYSKSVGWFSCPLEACREGDENSPPFPFSCLSKEFNKTKYILMVESTCCCWLFINEQNRDVTAKMECPCMDFDIDAHPCKKEEVSYDEVDLSSVCETESDVSSKSWNKIVLFPDLVIECDKEKDCPYTHKFREVKHFFIEFDGVTVTRSNIYNEFDKKPFTFIIHFNDDENRTDIHYSEYEEVEKAYLEYLSTRNTLTPHFQNVCTRIDGFDVARSPMFDFSSSEPYLFTVQGNGKDFTFNSHIKEIESAYNNYVTHNSVE